MFSFIWARSMFRYDEIVVGPISVTLYPHVFSLHFVDCPPFRVVWIAVPMKMDVLPQWALVPRISNGTMGLSFMVPYWAASLACFALPLAALFKRRKQSRGFGVVGDRTAA
jgi:hypothetical protein